MAFFVCCANRRSRVNQRKCGAAKEYGEDIHCSMIGAYDDSLLLRSTSRRRKTSCHGASAISLGAVVGGLVVVVGRQGAAIDNCAKDMTEKGIVETPLEWTNAGSRALWHASSADSLTSSSILDSLSLLLSLFLSLHFFGIICPVYDILHNVMHAYYGHHVCFRLMSLHRYALYIICNNSFSFFISSIDSHLI